MVSELERTSNSDANIAGWLGDPPESEMFRSYLDESDKLLISHNIRVISKNKPRFQALPTVEESAENPEADGAMDKVPFPPVDLEASVQNVKILGVSIPAIKEGKSFVKPNQSNIADHSYPWTRKLYLLNFQG